MATLEHLSPETRIDFDGIESADLLWKWNAESETWLAITHSSMRLGFILRQLQNNSITLHRVAGDVYIVPSDVSQSAGIV